VLKQSKKYKIKAPQEAANQSLINASSSIKPTGAKPLDADKALALMTQAKLSKYQYEFIRKTALDNGHDIYPSYKKVADSKKKMLSRKCRNIRSIRQSRVTKHA